MLRLLSCLAFASEAEVGQVAAGGPIPSKLQMGLEHIEQVDRGLVRQLYDTYSQRRQQQVAGRPPE